jgi:hypothetical protein
MTCMTHGIVHGVGVISVLRRKKKRASVQNVSLDHYDLGYNMIFALSSCSNRNNIETLV